MVVILLTLASLLHAVSIGASAIPVRLAADSVAIFVEGKQHYPELQDTLHSLCRSLSTEPRTYELDRLYRTKELQRVIVSDLSAICGRNTCVNSFEHASNNYSRIVTFT
jgi:hypothetical protein